MSINQLLKKCFKCKNAKCIKNCPLHLNVPTIVKLLENNNEIEAYQLLKENNVLVSICGAICPMEHQCARNCAYHTVSGNVFPINEIEQYLTNKYYVDDCYDFPAVTKRKIVIVGSGPSGLTSAILLRKEGFDVTVIEAENKIGGILSTHLPTFRFSNTILENKFSELSKYINFKLNCRVGKDISWDELFKYDYQIIAIGALNPIRMNKSENIYSGHELLKLYKENNLKLSNKKIAVLGCGNVAVDVARSLKRLNNDVTIVYRRTLENAPATKKEISEAINDQIKIYELLSLNTFNNGIAVFDKMGLEPKVGNERQVFFKTNEQQSMEFDILVEAYGSNPSFDGLEKFNWFNLINDNTWLKQNNHMNLYFVGDAYLHPSTIAKAIASAKDIVNKIIKNEDELSRLKEDIKDNKVIFGGSFNPVTIAHQEIVEYIIKNITSNVFLLPNGDKYNLKNLLPYNIRIEMIKLAMPNVLIDDYESKHPFKGTVKYLDERNHPFFVIGGDSMKDIINWIDFENLVSKNKFIVFNREDIDFESLFKANKILNLNRNNFYILNVSFSPVSSSGYRMTKNELFIDSKVKEYIEKNKLY